MNENPMWGLAPNAMSQSSIGVKGTKPIGGDFSLVFDWQTGFNPYAFQLSDGPGSLRANIGVPLDHLIQSDQETRPVQKTSGLNFKMRHYPDRTRLYSNVGEMTYLWTPPPKGAATPRLRH
jgi:hypothetical protein